MRKKCALIKKISAVGDIHYPIEHSQSKCNGHIFSRTTFSFVITPNPQHQSGRQIEVYAYPKSTLIRSLRLSVFF
jgi:hypothetical protein